MLQNYVDSIASTAVRSMMKPTSTAAAISTMPTSSTIIECTIGIVLITLIISVVLVIIKKVRAKKRRDEGSLIEMPLSTLLLTPNADPGLPSSKDASDYSTEVSEQTHVDAAGEASSFQTLAEKQQIEQPSIARIPDSPEAVWSDSTSSDGVAPRTASNHDVDIKLEHFPEYLLGVETIQRGALLARGGMANVFNGKYGVIPVALKEAVDSLDTLLNEAATIMKLTHPNVVQVYGIWKDRKERVFMVVSIIIVHCCD